MLAGPALRQHERGKRKEEGDSGDATRRGDQSEMKEDQKMHTGSADRKVEQNARMSSGPADRQVEREGNKEPNNFVVSETTLNKTSNFI